MKRTLVLDATKIREGGMGNFELIPKGYRGLFHVVKYGIKSDTKDGHGMITLWCDAVKKDGANWGYVFHNVVYFPSDHSAHGILVRLLKAMGLSHDGPIEHDDQDFVDKEFWADVDVEEKEGYKPKNIFKAIWTPEEADRGFRFLDKKDQPPDSPAFTDDEVPF